MTATTPTPDPLLFTTAPSPLPLSDPLWQQVAPLLLVGAGIAATIALLIAAVLVARGRPSSDARDDVPRGATPRRGPP